MDNKETLEEFAQNYAIKTGNHNDKDVIIDGAKWQQEQDKNKYSEEEVKAICKHYNSILGIEQDKLFVDEENWYEVGEENAFRKSIEKVLNNRTI